MVTSRRHATACLLLYVSEYVLLLGGGLVVFPTVAHVVICIGPWAGDKHRPGVVTRVTNTVPGGVTRVTDTVPGVVTRVTNTVPGLSPRATNTGLLTESYYVLLMML